jgi:hypothetical protein
MIMIHHHSLNFPANFPELAGATDVNATVAIRDANSIKNQFLAGNTTAADTVKILDFLVQKTYESTPHKESSPYACDIGGLAKLDCEFGATGSPRTVAIRAVTLAGLFLPALWATGGEPLSLEQAKNWYSSKDFMAMKELGLNTVQIPVPTSAFVPNNEYGTQVKEILEKILEDCYKADLQAILSLVATGDELDAVVSAGVYASQQPAVMALGLPRMSIGVKTVIESIRFYTITLPLLVPLDKSDLIKMDLEQFDENVYGSLETSHSATVADVASSVSQEDRSKMFYHEATACIARSPLEFASCFKGTPVFMSSGFDLAIDDCIFQNIATTFKDYGQCGRFDETVNSGWWHRHRQSLAARQLFAYERGLGWSFAAWKLYGDEEEEAGVIDTPEKLLSLKDVVAAGLFPDLTHFSPAHSACLNPPENDFALGDDTLAPTAGPPPDCGDGWWNYETSQCDYWVPPPEPTLGSTMASCPDCDGYSTSGLIKAGAAGSILTLLCVFMYAKTFGNSKQDEYSQIPNTESAWTLG